MRCEFPLIPFHDSFEAARRDFQRRMQQTQTRSARGIAIFETDDEVTIHLDVPGFSEAELSLSLHDGELQVTGERTITVPEGAVELFTNSAAGKLDRTVKLDDSIDPTSADAVVKNGVLTIVLKRRPELKPRQVTIRAAE